MPSFKISLDLSIDMMFPPMTWNLSSVLLSAGVSVLLSVSNQWRASCSPPSTNYQRGPERTYHIR